MKVNWRIIVGVIVLVFGAILLLQQVGVLPVHGDLFVSSWLPYSLQVVRHSWWY
jgi:hypothetical protein